MNGVVVDASMALSWCFEDEHDDLSDRVLAAVREAGAIVTPLWWLEVSNALASQVRLDDLLATIISKTTDEYFR